MKQFAHSKADGGSLPKGCRTINEHSNVFEEDELARTATIRKFRIVQSEGDRDSPRG